MANDSYDNGISVQNSWGKRDGARNSCWGGPKQCGGSGALTRQFFQGHGVVVDDFEEDNLLRDYFIPDYILLPESEISKTYHVPACPVMVFINSRSGGLLGGELLVTYRSILNKNQVVDLGEKAPDKVLHQLYVNIEKHKLSGDSLSSEIEKRLKLIVAGGDGTASWLLGVVSDLKLDKPPPIATVPLGTGNNLPFSFGWGKKNPATDCESVKLFLNQVKYAREMKIDSWHILMKMRAPEEGPCDPIAPLQLPHSLHAFRRVSQADKLSEEGFHKYRGGFWNYFSMGMDAQVSYAFHTERKLHPEKFRNQLTNQGTYAKLVCTQGWFCASLFHPPSKNIAQIAKVRIMRRPGQWEDLHIPRSIRSIVCLNLPSFSGGLNPWGEPTGNKHNSKHLTPPYVDDGLLEVVGFRDAWHGLVLYTPNGHGTRLAQANRIRFEFHKGGAEQTYMRIDGEPWKQPLPLNDETVVVEISHFGQANMLSNRLCRSQSVINAPTSPSTPRDNIHNFGSGNKEDFEEYMDEERKKLGAAKSFRYPQDVDISRLS